MKNGRVLTRIRVLSALLRGYRFTTPRVGGSVAGGEKKCLRRYRAPRQGLRFVQPRKLRQLAIGALPVRGVGEPLTIVAGTQE